MTENFLVIELDGVDTLVLLAGGYVFLVDEIQHNTLKGKFNGTKVTV